MVEHRGASKALKAPATPRLDVRQHPSHGIVLHPSSSQESQADSRSKEPPAPDAVRTKRTCAPRLQSGHRTGDEDSEPSTKHGQCVSALQKPDATRVAGLYAWNQLKRRVKKGERGIRILAPVIGIKRKKDEDAEKDIRIQNHAVLVGFRSAYVFDVSQTDGEELPELSTKVSGDVGERRERLIDFIVAQGIELEFKESIAPALGASYGGKIVLLPGQSTAEEFSTLVHELSHEMLHKADRRTATTKMVRETEAEAIAFVVGKTIGLDTGRVSADYIHLYHGNAALLAESLEVIQRTSAVILSALETPTAEAEAAQEAEPELAQAS